MDWLIMIVVIGLPVNVAYLEFKVGQERWDKLWKRHDELVEELIKIEIGKVKESVEK